MAGPRIRSVASTMLISNVVATAFCAGVAAEESTGSVVIAEIIVTAQKREESINDVPMSITAVSGQELSRREVTGAQDLTRIVPGFSYVESGASTPVYSVRGIGFYDTSMGARPTVSLYVDEVPLPFSAMGAGTYLDLERVEVLKGPQGTLFGQNSTGGAINYIAARPTREFDAEVDMSWGNFNALDVGGFISGPLSETVSARLAVRTQQSDDWMRSTTRDAEIGERDFTMARATLEWQPNDRLTARLTLNGFTDRSDSAVPQLFELFPNTPAAVDPFWPLLRTLTPAPQDNRAADWDADADFARDNSFYQAAARADYEITPSVTLTSITSYGRYEIEQLTEADGVFLQNYRTAIDGHATSAAQELRLAGDLDRIRWVLGVNYSEDETHEDNYSQNHYSTAVTAFGGNIDDVAGFTHQDFETRAVFANVDFEVTDAITVHAGARYTQADLSYAACSRAVSAPQDWTFLFDLFRFFNGLPPLAAPIAPGDCVTLDATLTPGTVTGELNEDSVSWRAGVDWSPDDDLLFYVNASKGYKAGSAPTVAALQDAQTDPVTQESVLAYEAGFKVLVARSLQLNGAVFLYDYNDKQLRGRKSVVPNIVGPIGALVNVPESRIRGAELQADWYPTADFVANLGVTYVDSEVTDSFVNIGPTAIPADFAGDSFPYTPRLQYVANFEYRWNLTDAMRLFFGAAATYRDETAAGFGSDPRLTIDAYTLFDGRVGVESTDGIWRATLWGKNLTDEYYWSNVVYTSDVIVRYAGAPRTFGVRVSYRFN